jgi:hypothetical protein
MCGAGLFNPYVAETKDQISEGDKAKGAQLSD